MPLFQHRHHCALAKALEEVSDIAETAPVINALICALVEVDLGGERDLRLHLPQAGRKTD